MTLRTITLTHPGCCAHVGLGVGHDDEDRVELVLIGTGIDAQHTIVLTRHEAAKLAEHLIEAARGRGRPGVAPKGRRVRP